MNFYEKRLELLKEAYEFKANNNIDSDFSRRFFEIVEEAILYLLESNDNFFGQFMLKVKRKIRLEMTYPVGTVPKRDGFNMYFNPILFLQCTKKEMAALFKHEIYHIMYSHYERKKSMEIRYNNEAIGAGLDISINQYIRDLPPYSQKIESVNRQYNLDLKEDRSVEEYSEKIYASIKSRIKEFVDKSDESTSDVIMENAHDIWSEIDMSSEEIDSLTKKTAISAFDENAPEGLEGIISKYNEKPQISWQKVLKSLLPSVKSGYKKTITRRNRRQPERMDLKGCLPNKEVQLIVALDISASINDKDLYKILIEVISITSYVKNDITVIECDDKIRKIYKLRNKNDIKNREKDNGSTKFSPVFEYIKQNNLRDSILIYFTDGVGERDLEVRPINKKTLWVLCGEDDLSLNKPYGKIRRIDTVKHEKIEGNVGLQMINSVIHDWAR